MKSSIEISKCCGKRSKQALLSLESWLTAQLAVAKRQTKVEEWRRSKNADRRWKKSITVSAASGKRRKRGYEVNQSKWKFRAERKAEGMFSRDIFLVRAYLRPGWERFSVVLIKTDRLRNVTTLKISHFVIGAVYLSPAISLVSTWSNK